MARGDTLDLEILRGVAGQFEDFGGKVLEDSGHINSGWTVLAGGHETWDLGSRHTLSANTHLVLGVVLQETLDTTTGELDRFKVSVADFRIPVERDNAVGRDRLREGQRL